MLNLKIILLILTGVCASQILIAQVLDTTSTSLSGDTLLLPSDSLILDNLKNRVSIDTSSVSEFIENTVKLDFSPIDSIYENSFLGDSMFFQEQVKDRIKNQLQNLEWQKLIALDFQIPSSFKLKGSVYSSYNFGPQSNLNTLASPRNSINGGLDLAFQPFAIPIKITARYNQYAVIPQVENFVRVSFDREFYRNYLNDLINSKKDILEQAKQNLLDERASLEGELAYQYYNATSIKEVQLLQTDFTFEGNINELAQFDHTLPSTDIPDAGISEVANRDSLSAQSGMSQTPDSLDGYKPTADLADVNSKIQAIETKRSDLSSKVTSLEKFQGTLSAVQGFKDVESANDWRKLLKYLDAFELGQTNPSYTVFILAKQPVNGINIKTEVKNRRYWFTHGQTQGFFLLDPSSKENVLRSMFGDFIPTSRSIGDRITSFGVEMIKSEKFGLLWNGLYGIDKYNELSSMHGESTIAPFSGRNFSTEIEGYYLFHRNHMLEFGVARSLNQNLQTTDENGALPMIGGNAYSGCWTSVFPKRRMEIELNYRRVDELFKSLGNIFLREDQQRAEVKVSKKVGKKVGLTLGGKKYWSIERTPMFSNLELIDAKITYKPLKNLILMAGGMYGWNEVISYDYQSTSTLYQNFYSLIYSVNSKNWTHEFTPTVMQIGNNGDSLQQINLDIIFQYSIISTNGFSITQMLKRSVAEGFEEDWSGEYARYEFAMTVPIGKKIISQAGLNMNFLESEQYSFGGEFGISALLTEKFSLTMIARYLNPENIYSENILSFYRNNPLQGSLKLNYNLL